MCTAKRGEQRVLVTGATGFIGSHVADYLHAFFEVAGTGRRKFAPLWTYCQSSLRDEVFTDFLRQFQPQVIVHCAGPSSVSTSIQHPIADFQAGPDLLMHVYDTLRKLDLRPLLIHISSAAVYGNPCSLPVAETAMLKPQSPYGWHKQMAELVMAEYARSHAVPGWALRVFSCYGEGQRKLLLWDAARKIMNGKAEFFGSGMETRDYLHVRDLARLIHSLINNAAPVESAFHIINAASGVAVPVREMILRLSKALGKSHYQPVFNGQERQGDPLHWQADIQVLRALDFKPEIDLTEGLQRYACWFLSLPPEEWDP